MNVGSGSLVAKVLNYWLEGCVFESQVRHTAAVGPLSKAELYKNEL